MARLPPSPGSRRHFACFEWFAVKLRLPFFESGLASGALPGHRHGMPPPKPIFRIFPLTIHAYMLTFTA